MTRYMALAFVFVWLLFLYSLFFLSACWHEVSMGTKVIYKSASIWTLMCRHMHKYFLLLHMVIVKWNIILRFLFLLFQPFLINWQSRTTTFIYMWTKNHISHTQTHTHISCIVKCYAVLPLPASKWYLNPCSTGFCYNLCIAGYFSYCCANFL